MPYAKCIPEYFVFWPCDTWTFLLLLLFPSLQLAKNNIIDICLLILYTETFFSWFNGTNRFICWFLGMVYLNSLWFTNGSSSSLPVCMPLIFLIVYFPGRTFSTLLNRTDILSFFPVLVRTVFHNIQYILCC